MRTAQPCHAARTVTLEAALSGIIIAAAEADRSSPPPKGYQPLARGERLHHLDSLRGLAAVVVVAHHALLATSIGGLQAGPWSVFNIVVVGRPAVILFFVLSGFVLTLHLSAAEHGFLSFAVRRLVRLMPPYMVAIIVAAAAYGVTQDHRPTGLSVWFDAQWGGLIGAADVLRHLAMLAGPRQYPLDHVAWSLVHELRLSLALPLFLRFQRRYGSVGALAAAGAITLAADGVLVSWPDRFPAGVYGLRFDAEGVGPSVVLTARFCLAFALGAVLATHGAAIRATMRRPAAGLLALATALGLLSARDETFMALGSALLIAVAAWSPPIVTALRVRPLLWIGRISFSLYLVHLPTMLACVYIGQGHGTAWGHLLAGLGLALPIAAAMVRGVEEPTTKYSRVAAQMVSRAWRAGPWLRSWPTMSRRLRVSPAHLDAEERDPCTWGIMGAPMRSWLDSQSDRLR